MQVSLPPCSGGAATIGGDAGGIGRRKLNPDLVVKECGAEEQKARRKPILRNFKQLSEAERGEVYQSWVTMCTV